MGAAGDELGDGDLGNEAGVGRGPHENHLNRLLAWGVEEDGAKEEGCSCKTPIEVGHMGFAVVRVGSSWGLP